MHPESSLRFPSAIDEIMGELEEPWGKGGLGMPTVGYAGDVIILVKTNECSEKSASGLRAKKHWSSTMPNENETLDINDESDEWSACWNGAEIWWTRRARLAIPFGSSYKTTCCVGVIDFHKMASVDTKEESLRDLDWHMAFDESTTDQSNIFGSSGERSSPVPVRGHGNPLATPSQRGTQVADKIRSGRANRLARHIARMTGAHSVWSWWTGMPLDHLEACWREWLWLWRVTGAASTTYMNKTGLALLSVQLASNCVWRRTP